MAKNFKPVSLDFIGSAPYRYAVTVQVAHPIDVVFAALVDDPAQWAKWFAGFSSKSKWLTPGPQGVGSQRLMVMRGLALTETVIASDAPRHWAFYIARGTMPGVRAFAEDYQLEATEGGTALTWTLAIDAAAPMKPLVPLIGKMALKQFVAAGAKLDAYLR